ncbi:MAG: hypothetical protein U1E21_10205 [Reyranellaceae bacterium]
MAIAYQPVANSTYLDYSGYGITSVPTVESAYGISDGVTSPFGVNVALVLPRVTDPSGFLAQDWGTRQQTLEELNSKGTLWSTYGASQSQYNTLVGNLESAPFGLKVLHDNPTNGNYVSSAEARTIWVNIPTAADFQTLFNTPLMYSKSADLLYWNGNLSLPTGWNVTGLWIDYDAIPPATNLSTAMPVTLTLGSQSPGNASTSKQVDQDPQVIAALYDFPLDGQTVQTGTIGLIEPLIGSALLSSQTASFQSLLTDYLTAVGRSGTGTVYTQGSDGQVYNRDYAGERSLDVGVVSSVNPNSNIGLYVGSGGNGDANASVFTAIQSAIWDTVATAVGNTTAKAAVTSNSYDDDNSLRPGSPFYRAYTELFVDAVLANQTTFIALGDGGSGDETANGLPNVRDIDTQPWNVLVGGTSLSTTGVAEADPTLGSLVASAMAGDPATIWRLVAGGLTDLPSKAGSASNFVETVWNAYYVENDTGQLEITASPGYAFDAGYLVNSTGSGGVDTTQPIPSYQMAFGLHPVTADPQHLSGRGTPDVSADAGGNLDYIVPTPQMVGTDASGGTSAASPLWASLAIQLNAIFADQKLPNLGYMNDLLYTAAMIAPASFNDVTLGDNTSSFFEPGQYLSNGTDISPTGYGYAAGWGYDLTSGLGSPNGLLLARTLTAIAHSELSYDDTVPQVLNSYGAGGWTSGTQQSLLIQTVSPVKAHVDVTAGSTRLGLSSAATETYAWTARFAGQSEQSDFDADLVRLFDRYGQGAVGQVAMAQGDAFAVAIDGVAAEATTASLTSQFGFVDFQAAAGLVRVARPVAVAETVDALSDQTVVVHIRQSGVDNLKLSFYRVDDFTGSIGGVAPGAASYEAAAQLRTYQTTTGATSIDGPGYGQHSRALLNNIDSGDIVAMKLVDTTQGKTYWAFSQANEVVGGQNVGHIWNYGLNTWGWEDTFGGGDQDYNDLVVSLDFTSAFGHGWLV